MNNNNNNSKGISNVDQVILNNAAIVGNGLNYVKNIITNNGNIINWTVLIILFIFIIFL